MANQIQIRRDTRAAWAAANPVLAEGELGIETDAVPVQFKVGDGTTAWNSLAYVASGSMDVASSTLDDLVDGTTYKRIAAAVATALNAGTYDAAKCTAYGIGTQTPTIMATSVDNYKTNGIYKDPGSLTNSPFGENQAKILVISQDTSHCSQLAFRYGSGAGAVYVKVRNWNGASWGDGWKDIWTSDSDGNGGQPPAPKPNTTGTGTQGYWYIATLSGTATWVNPGGTYAYDAIIVTTASGAVANRIAGVTTGNLSPGTADQTTYIMAWRIA